VTIEWHPLALADLLDLIAYIATDDPGTANRVRDEIQRQTDMLSTHPQIGRHGRVTGTRELVVIGTPYLIAYRIAPNVVTILRVLHGARRWPEKL
jgi:toxin ParE1/3/4